MRSKLLVAVVLVSVLACAGCSSGPTEASLGLEKLDAAAPGAKSVAASPAEKAALTVAIAMSEAAPVKVARKTSSTASPGSGSSSGKTSTAADEYLAAGRAAAAKLPPLTVPPYTPPTSP